MSEIQEFYRNKSIFITGGTGFIGKLVIYKLLKTTNVKSLYLIIRPKKGMNLEQRTKQLFNEEIFPGVKDETDRIKSFEGDLAKLNLGLSTEDRNTIEEQVDIIIHCGAHLNFLSSIQDSILSNVRSTREILSIAKNCKNLISFLYISTAYSNCPFFITEEKFFSSPIDPNVMISMAEELDNNLLERIGAELKGAWPNFYTFSKNLSESLIKDVANTIPVGLLRPSIITSTSEEPVKGWTDNLYGPTGIILNINLGILRALHTSQTVKLDLVPADKVANAILCALWEIDQRWKKIDRQNYSPLIINFSGKDTPIYIEIRTLLKKTKTAMKSSIWFPVCFLIYNSVAFTIADHICHRIPYYILDKIASLNGTKSLPAELHKKVDKACKALYFFMSNEWMIQNINTMVLWNKLNDTDRELYNFNVQSVDCDEYFKSYSLGIRKYIAKENINDIAEDEQRLRRLKLIHMAAVGILLLLFFMLINMLVNSIVLPILV